jgi:hypothetical protein
MYDMTEEVLQDFLFPEEEPRDEMSLREYLRRSGFGDILDEGDSRDGFVFARFNDDDSEDNGLVDLIVTHKTSYDDREDLELRLSEVIQICGGGA